MTQAIGSSAPMEKCCPVTEVVVFALQHVRLSMLLIVFHIHDALMVVFMAAKKGACEYGLERRLDMASKGASVWAPKGVSIWPGKAP